MWGFTFATFKSPCLTSWSVRGWHEASLAGVNNDNWLTLNSTSNNLLETYAGANIMFFSVTCSVTALNVNDFLKLVMSAVFVFFFHGEILNRHPLPNTQNFQNPVCGWTNLCQIKKKWMNFVVQVLYYNNDWLFWLIPSRNFHGRCKVGPWKQMIL